MLYKVIRLTGENTALLPHKQQSFWIFGKLIPTFDGVNWSVAEEIFSVPREKTYPDENFDPNEYVDSDEQAAYLAMLGSECVGSIRVCRRWNGNGFIDDLAIDAAHRRRGLGRLLMDAAAGWARENGLNGMSLETQDDNLAACRFYIKYGYRLCGIDTRVYTHPSYIGETALYFYYDLL